MNLIPALSIPDEETPFDNISRAPSRGVAERRRLGAYYTPERLSRLLSHWAIRTGDETILEPSFGGCGFVSAAMEALKKAGATNAVSQIYGCDIDPCAFDYLSEMLGEAHLPANFLLQDFLDYNKMESWPATFDVVLANPPYIPHHRIGRDRVRELSERSWTVPNMGGRASLWGYFINHTLTFLRPGGRMAWVLPGAFLQADYARSIRTYVSANFERAVAFVVHDRIFLSEGTDEETVVLLAEGYGNGQGEPILKLGETSSLDELEELIFRWANCQWESEPNRGSAASLSLTGESKQVFDELASSHFCSDFAAIGKVQIGLVTGANDFFVLSESQISAAGLAAEDCKMILSKFKAAKGLELYTEDLLEYAQNGGRSYLVTSRSPDDDSAISRYVQTFDQTRKALNSTFRKRAVWSQTCDDRIPDAFFPVMHHGGPRIVLNRCSVNCTNTIHRIFFRDGRSPHELKLIAISFLTSFSQISAELVGRRYGSGVLKHEPRDAEKIMLLLPICDPGEVDLIYEGIDLALRGGDELEAMSIADAFIFSQLNIRDAHGTSEKLISSLNRIRKRRRPDRSLRANIAQDGAS
ncbi:N-6 DNA methylase (plasmid) [Rhizobium sp. TH2]|uniref:SAM-dependent methyltransferase n=1 Tax=Rhizobium sp. TH2 TaxID=2775403 RepID=UPI002157DFF8|nr:SAM-dependent methyltransferase [Rhizobium sp. TH2]UVC12659.1 N-6 DNA methylase [Rhizobium sp. TH2]